MIEKFQVGHDWKKDGEIITYKKYLVRMQSPEKMEKMPFAISSDSYWMTMENFDFYSVDSYRDDAAIEKRIAFLEKKYPGCEFTIQKLD